MTTTTPNRPEESVFTPPAVHPFSRSPICSACGSASGRGLRPLMMKLYYGLSGFNSVDVTYCKGSQPPSDMVPMMNPMAVLAGRSAMGESAQVNYECYGLFRPHLHIRCRHCGQRWFMEPMQP